VHLVGKVGEAEARLLAELAHRAHAQRVVAARRLGAPAAA
jgi:hypothetical protein